MDELNIGKPGNAPTRQMSKQTRQAAGALNALLQQQKDGEAQPAAPEPAPALQEPLEIPAPEGADLDDEEFDDGMRYAGTHVDNPTVRRQIEARCGPIDFDELLTSGKVSQKVPILPGKYEVIFQSVGGDEDLYIKEQIFESKGSDGLLMDKYSYMRLAVFVKAINGQLLPQYRDTKGNIDDAAFERRWRMISSKAEAELEILSCNARWFHDRTQQMWIVDDLKNG